MANQLKMADIQAILALHGHGWSNRRIALELGICRETVNHHVREAESKPASAPTGSCSATGPITEPSADPLPDDDATAAGSCGDGSDSKPASAPPGSRAAIDPINHCCAPDDVDDSGTTLAEPSPSKAAGAPTGSSCVLATRPDGPKSGDSSAATPAAQSSAAWPFRQAIQQKLDQGLSAQRIFQDLHEEQKVPGTIPVTCLWIIIYVC
jgi:hypothetical protein